MEKEYQEKYGAIPDTYVERLDYLLSSTNYKHVKESVYKRLEENNHIKWKTVQFTLYLLPKATPRPRSTSRGGFFYVSGAKDNKKYFEKYMLDKDWEVITTPCVFQVDTYYPIPESMSKQEKILAELGSVRPISKPDWDNVGKTYSDMIQGILLYDDSLIIEGISRKFYSVKPRIVITIRYMESFDSNYNEKKMKKKEKKGRNLL